MTPQPTLYALMAANLPLRKDHPALIDDGVSISYRRLADEVDRLAGCFLLHDIRPGDRVVVQLRKSLAEVAAMLAISKIGAVMVNVSAQWTVDQLSYAARDCSARLLVVERAMAAKLEWTDAAILVAADAIAGSTAAPVSDPPARCGTIRANPELAAILYTSGSTGMPKGVMLSHANLVEGARSVVGYLHLTSEDRLLSVLPYSFDYGLNQLISMLLVGGAVVHQPVPMATEILRAIGEHGVTGVAAVPPLWSQIVRLLDAQPRAFPSLRRITNSGGGIPPNILERFPHVFPGVDIYLMYGLTEAFRSTFLAPDMFARKMGSIGRAIPGAEIYVIQHGKGIAGPGEQGELVHRGPLVSLGYWNKPDATHEKIRSCPELSAIVGDEPVVYSGDIVRIDADGDLWFVGRNDALIKSSGYRISPDEVEDLVHRSGMVTDVVAFGVDDALLGQVVHLAVTPLAGFDHAALVGHCRQAMPSYMVPRTIHLWPDAMPRTASGKLSRPDVVRSCRSTILEVRA